MSNGKIVATFCTGGEVEVEMMRSLHESYQYDRDHDNILDPNYIDVVGGPRLHVMRTEAVRRFLQGDGEWLWSIDSDMAWANDAIYRLLAAATLHKLLFVGGLCFGTSRTAGALFPTVYKRDDAGHMAVDFDLPRDELVKCDATGFAFVLVHRSVFERMAAPEAFGLTPDGHVDLLPWFVDGQCGDILMEGDLAFCARASALGIPIHVHTGVDVFHKKPAMHGRELYDTVLELQTAGGQ